MTEERFEQAVEQAADRFDKSVNRLWNRHRSLRVVSKGAALLTGAGLMASALPLAEQGRGAAAKACLIGGGAVVGFTILELMIFRRK